MNSDQRARAVRAVFGRARDLARFKPSAIAETAATIVKQMPSIGFCSTDYTVQPISMPRIATLHGQCAA